MHCSHKMIQKWDNELLNLSHICSSSFKRGKYLFLLNPYLIHHTSSVYLSVNIAKDGAKCTCFNCNNLLLSTISPGQPLLSPGQRISATDRNYASTQFHLPSAVEIIQAYKKQAKQNLMNKQVIPYFDSTELGSNYTWSW